MNRRQFILGAAGLAVPLPRTAAIAAAIGPSFQGTFKPFIFYSPPFPAPPAAFTDRHGRAMNAMAFFGEAIVLNFWASWCAPCVWELPHLDRLHRRYRHRGLRVLAVSEDTQGPAHISTFYERHGIHDLAIHMDPGGAAIREYGWIHGLPITYIIDRRSRMVGYMDGSAEWDSSAAHRLIETVLNIS